MSKVTVVGAGNVGATCANVLALDVYKRQEQCLRAVCLSGFVLVILVRTRNNNCINNDANIKG